MTEIKFVPFHEEAVKLILKESEELFHLKEEAIELQIPFLHQDQRNIREVKIQLLKHLLETCTPNGSLEWVMSELSKIKYDSPAIFDAQEILFIRQKALIKPEPLSGQDYLDDSCGLPGPFAQ